MKKSLGLFWRNGKKNYIPLACLFFLLVVFFLAVGADFIAPYDPILQDRNHMLSPPFWQEGSAGYILGTDAVGRDLLSNLIHGARYSLFIGAFVVCLSLSFGVVFGLMAGYFGGWLDYLLMRVMDILLAFPSLLLALVLVAVLGPGLINSTLAIAVVQLPHFVRLTRAQALQEKKKEYFMASKLVGASSLRLMFSHLLPNCMSPLIVQSTLNFSNAILDAAALGFLGLGAQPPTPEWGTMLASAREFIFSAWWLVFFPGLAILVTVLTINILGDSLRDLLDPKLKKA